MMRMFAWVNLLQDDGLVNRVLSFGGLFDVDVNWLTGQPVVVILGLVYGYVPYMILPLYAGLDRLPQPMLEASRDLGADRFSSFWRVTLPLCRPTIVAALLLTCLPMLGDYFTNDMLSASPKTAMVGNLINDSVQAPGQTGQAGAFVMLVFLVALLPMLYYVRGDLARRRGVHVRGPRGMVERPVAAPAGAGRRHRRLPGLVAAACPVAVLYSFNDGRSRTMWQGFSFRWYWGDPTLSVWHDDALHTALLQTLKLGVITTLITVPLGVLFAIGIDRWRGRLPAGANFLMLISFVLPEVLLAVALLFVITTVALPIELGTTAQVVGLVTFQVSYPAVLVRARLATIGPQYEEAAMDLGARRSARCAASSCRC